MIFEEEHQLNRLFMARMGENADPAPRPIAVPGHVSAMAISRDGRR
jgi:hypothetical protein